MLSKEQYRFLKKLNKLKLIQYELLSEEEISICEYLENEKLIEIIKEGRFEYQSDILLTYDVPTEVKIKGQGEAHFTEIQSDKKRFLVPLIINTILSVSAIIISIIAIVVTYSAK